QLPGAGGKSSGGQPEFIEPLAQAATAVGIAGVFVETHDHPERALSDGANALHLNLLSGFWSRLRQIDALVKSF
ncbi:MAG: 3-deoxy-8-phosphooctulonate synthase, partial [Acidobacteriota bacterium]|nr:3-deoxy-8-phosphooctulonate synthase [Acidobacteriota bacterium]